MGGSWSQIEKNLCDPMFTDVDRLPEHYRHNTHKCKLEGGLIKCNSDWSSTKSLRLPEDMGCVYDYSTGTHTCSTSFSSLCEASGKADEPTAGAGVEIGTQSFTRRDKRFCGGNNSAFQAIGFVGFVNGVDGDTREERCKGVCNDTVNCDAASIYNDQCALLHHIGSNDINMDVERCSEKQDSVTFVKNPNTITTNPDPG